MREIDRAAQQLQTAKEKELARIAARLEVMNLRAVAEKTGVGYTTIRLIVQGATTADIETVRKLSEWLDNQS